MRAVVDDQLDKPASPQYTALGSWGQRVRRIPPTWPSTRYAVVSGAARCYWYDQNGRSASMKRTLAIASAAAIAGGVTAFSLASYATSGNTSSGSPPSSDDAYAAAVSTAAPATPNGQRQLLHGERVVKDKDGKIITIDVQRGTVTAASPSSMTVR